jgi:thioredoxin reductase
MNGDFTILSPSSWMRLPGVDFGDPEEKCDRATVSDYYASYPENVGIAENFRHSVRVTRARRVQDVWEVEFGAADAKDKKRTTIRVRYLIAAVGMYDVPLQLGIPGESQSKFVTHRIPKEWPPEGSTVVVVGAGLSAADCICECFKRKLKVQHIFRRKVSPTSSGSLDRFDNSWNGYPEYSFLFELMKIACGTSEISRAQLQSARIPLSFDPTNVQYEAFPERQVQSILDNNVGLNNGKVVKGADVVVILIGSKPSFDWLEGVPEKEHFQNVDAKKKPVPIDPDTFRHSDGLFVVGPAAGDNFVRYLTGHAYGVARAIQEERK